MFITTDNKKTFKAIVILNAMINGTHPFKLIDNGPDHVLQPLFTELMARGYVQESGLYYLATPKGQEVFSTFMKRYTEYIKVYDVYSFVDLEKGEFAFSSYYDFDTDDDWANFTDDDRFEDLRIAVAIFKKLDPAEIVFMSFINENRFDTNSAGWQADLVADNFWAEIEEICGLAVKPEEVGNDAMVEMINQGSELMMQLMDEEKQRAQGNNAGQGDGYYEEVVVEEPMPYYDPYYVPYYDAYYDPYYVSPIWFTPLFLW